MNHCGTNTLSAKALMFLKTAQGELAPGTLLYAEAPLLPLRCAAPVPIELPQTNARQRLITRVLTRRDWAVVCKVSITGLARTK